MNILICGASSDLGEKIIPAQLNRGHKLGLHCGKRPDKLSEYENNMNLLTIKRPRYSESDCSWIINEYIKWSGGIDRLVLLLGGVLHTDVWQELCENDYIDEYKLNAIYPMILAGLAAKRMQDSGGRIVFVSTASAGHGGGGRSLGYGMAKAGLECGMKRLAKDLAQYNIQVNAVAPGYMDTSLQLRTKGIPTAQNRERLSTIPMGRAGTKEEFSDLIDYLLNSKSEFMTGQVLTLDGGDFI